ncbi:hypothetical protein V490_07567 [Pseudogymnoascus sp. VKM F-3557]|nr:hypothetical protein V490_07567 [Pseudogymnoascus sp. VKM F-3557]
MTSIEDYSMFGSNFGSQPHLDSPEDFSFAVDPAKTAASCSHRKLQEVLTRGNPMTAMINISECHAEQTQAPQSITALNYDNEIERLKRDLMGVKVDNETRMDKIEKLHEMFLSLTNTVAKQGVAIKQMIEEMSPELSETFFRGFKEELHKLPKNSRSK